MLRNYLKVAWRNLTRNRVSSIINIGGLAAGMAVAMLIGLWIYDEVSFDHDNAHIDRIGHVMVHNGVGDDEGTYGFLPFPVAQTLRTEYGHYFSKVVLTAGASEHVLGVGDKKFTQRGPYIDPGGPELMSVKMREGTRNGLTDPRSILLSASVAEKLFGSADPIGQTVLLDTMAVKVTGVYEDLPVNSSFHDVTFMAPLDLLLATNSYASSLVSNWDDNSFLIYVMLAPGINFDDVSRHIAGMELPHLDAGRAANKPAIFVHPMRKWHLYSTFEHRALVSSAALKFVWFYAAIGLFVLLLACINFMNLSTARSERRAREVGVRKTMGSARSQLVAQFYCESMLTTLLAFAIAVLAVQVLLPWFNGVSAKAIDMPWARPWFWIAGLAFTLTTGLLAGSYPALYLSSFRPVKVLKGVFHAGRTASLPRKVLVVFQFTVSIALIIGTLVVYRQVQYAKDRPVGYTRTGLLQIQMTSPDFQGKYDVLTDALTHTGVVASMAESSQAVTGSFSNTGGLEWPGKSPSAESDFAIMRVTPEYAATLNLTFAEGRNFSRAFATDSDGLVINEAAARYMNLTHPAGQLVRWDNGYEGMHNKTLRILGVIRDVVSNSPFEPVKQTIYSMRLTNPGWIIIRIDPHTSAAVALPKIAAVFHRLIPSAPFDYSFVDDDYASKFAAEERVGTLAGFFAALAILISCLGLFGLAAYTAEQRTKEIGVRKVLGATVADIWGMLSIDFVKLTLLSCLVATPLAFLFMHRWLAQYAYRASISAWLLAAVALGAVALTVATVSFQAVRAARRKPVTSLRSE